MRRTRIKPVLSAPVRRKVQPNTENDSNKPEEPSTPQKKEESTVVEEVNDVPATLNESSSKTKEKNDQPAEKITQDVSEAKDSIQTSADLPAVSSAPPSKSAESHPPKVAEGSPASSVKIAPANPRSCFMRPTPRLDGGGSRIRRNSVQGSATSASESEDDSRKSSVCSSNRTSDLPNSSVQNSGAQGEANSTGNQSMSGKLNFSQKRKMVVSESARKLAEARREFNLKHENNTPDKSKLTMYDLIYYNPKTNPMKPKPKATPRKLSVGSDAEEKKEEKEPEQEAAPASEEEEASEILVPQVKIGPNGQLIIDEKSLVIDQYKSQENLDRSEIVVDEDTGGNGFYKRRAKSKEWNKWETIKFYKALNTYGTDFLLMQNVFPNRNRQELKLKYKKEERFNSNLVEKALRYQAFDEEALKKDFENVDASEAKEAESIKLVRETALASKLKKKTKRCHLVAQEVNCDESLKTKNSRESQSSDEDSRITITRSKKMRKRILVPIDDDSDSEDESLKVVKKTKRKKNK